MSRRILFCVVLIVAIIAAVLVEVVPAPLSAQASSASSPAAPADVPEVFHTDPEGGIFHLTLKDNLLYYHSPCGGELQPARSRVRSKPTGMGMVRDLYYPATCQPDYVQSVNVAADNSYVYWLTANDQVVRLPRGASAGDTPQIVASMAATSTVYSWITVDNTQVFWSEGSNLYYAPKDGSGSRLWVWDYSSNHGPGFISQLTADGSGAVYLLYANTVYRDPITATEIPVSASGRGQGLTLGNNRVYWSEKDASLSTVYLKSAPVLTPTTGVDPLSTIDGTGNPVVANLAVDSTNLFWHEARSNVGPLRRMAITGGAVNSIVLSMISPNSLVTDGSHVYWDDYFTIYRLPTTASAFTLDLVGNDQPPEVIQTVQNGTGGVTELVRGKETFVRVYGRIFSSDPVTTSITSLRPAAMLHGFRGSTELPGSPLTPINFNTPLTNALPDRTQLNSSYWFRLPTAWVTGTIWLTTAINPNHTLPETDFTNNTYPYAVTVTFAPKSPICIYLVPVSTVRGPTIAALDPMRGDETFFTRARTLLPTNELRVFYRGGPLLTKPRWYLWDSDPFALTVGADDTYWVIFWSNVRYLFSSDPASCSADNARTVHVTMAPDPFPQPRSGDLGARALNGIQGGGSLLYFTFAMPYGGYTTNIPAGGVTLAHELGHFYGRSHVNCGAPSGIDSGYPYPPCQLDNVGPNSNLGYDRLTNQLLLPANTGDLMSYANNPIPPEPRWTSDYTWRAIYNAINLSPSIPTPSTLGPQRPAGPSATLLVNGVFSSTGAYVGPAYQVSGALETDAINHIVDTTQLTTTYEVRVYDAGHVLLGSMPLRIFDAADDAGISTTTAFMNWVDYSTLSTPTRIDVVRLSDDAAVGSITAGANPPTVTITSPTGGSFTTGLTATWTGSDPDGDTVLYTVRYSPDNGATWIALATALHANQLTVPLNDGLPGGAQALIQVLATDGIHTTVATSAPFSVALHAPQPAIFDDGGNLLNTVMITSAQQSDIVVLNGQAYDAEDGPLSGTALQWNVSGPVNQTGSGGQLTLFNLPPATYGVQLTAKDSNGLMATATTSVTITPKHVFDGATPTLDGYCADIGYDSELDPISLRYTGVISVAQVHFAHADGALWACFSGLQIGAMDNSFAGIRADVDNSGGPWAMPSDLGFFVGRDGVPFTAHGDGAGGFPGDTLPNGLTAAVSQDTANGTWNAELRIDETTLGGWNHLVKLKVSHYWRNFTGDDFIWPAGSYWNVPSTWGLTSLGSLSQSIVFDSIANHNSTDPAFAVTASASSGLPVTFESLTTNVCTILGNQVTLTGGGTCTLLASQPGNATYFAATVVTRSFSVFSKVYLPLVIR